MKVDKRVKNIPLTKENLNGAVRVHFNNLQEGLIFELGEALATHFYQEIVRDSDSWGYLAVVGHFEVGIVVCTLNVKKVSTLFYRKNLIQVVKGVLPRLLQPTLLKHILEALTIKKEGIPTLLFLVMDEDQRGKGIGSVLIDTIIKDFQRRGVRKFIVELNEGNPAEEFYKKKGFTFKSCYKVFGKNRRVLEYEYQ
ncbi:MAG: GNAT family N-acetyltransferase [Methanobacteriota archaeon]